MGIFRLLAEWQNYYAPSDTDNIGTFGHGKQARNNKIIVMFFRSEEWIR